MDANQREWLITVVYKALDWAHNYNTTHEWPCVVLTDDGMIVWGVIEDWMLGKKIIPPFRRVEDILGPNWKDEIEKYHYFDEDVYGPVLLDKVTEWVDKHGDEALASACKMPF